MIRPPLLFLLCIVLLQGKCYAQNTNPFHARAMASTLGSVPVDNPGIIAASATVSDVQDGTHIAQAHVTGVPAPTIRLPSEYPLYLGAATSNDTNDLTRAAVSVATANWNDRMTIISPTVVNRVIFSISLLGSVEVSVKDVTNPKFTQEAEAGGELSVYTRGTYYEYEVNNRIPRGSVSAIYETSMSDNVTAASVNYADPNNRGTRIHYRLPVVGNIIDFDVTLRALSATNNGVARALFSDTAILTGVFLEDGTTPESHGMSLVFDSGIPSPNIVVPEPGSMVLFGLSLLCLIGGTNLRQCRAKIA